MLRGRTDPDLDLWPLSSKFYSVHPWVQVGGFCQIQRSSLKPSSSYCLYKHGTDGWTDDPKNIMPPATAIAGGGIQSGFSVRLLFKLWNPHSHKALFHLHDCQWCPIYVTLCVRKAVDAFRNVYADVCCVGVYAYTHDRLSHCALCCTSHGASEHFAAFRVAFTLRKAFSYNS